MISLYQFFISGIPKPQGRPKARVVIPKDGREPFASVYSPTTDWRRSVQARCENVRFRYNAAPVAPLRVRLAFYLDRPKADFGTGRNAGKLKARAPRYCTKRADVDNLAKAVLDAMTDAKLIQDDMLVVDLHVVKHWAACDNGQAGVRINIGLPACPQCGGDDVQPTTREGADLFCMVCDRGQQAGAHVDLFGQEVEF